MLRENPWVYKKEWRLWYHNVIFVVSYDFENQECSVNHIPEFQAYTFWLGFRMLTLLLDTWNVHHFHSLCNCLRVEFSFLLLPETQYCCSFQHVFTWFFVKQRVLVFPELWSCGLLQDWVPSRSPRSGKRGQQRLRRGKIGGKILVFKKERKIWTVPCIYKHAQEHLGETLSFNFQCKLWELTSSLFKESWSFYVCPGSQGLDDDFILKSCKTHELMNWERKLDETKMTSSEIAVGLHSITQSWRGGNG